MTDDSILRVLAFLLAVAVFSISIYHRHKADQLGGQLTTEIEDRPVVLVLRVLFALTVLAAVTGYTLSPGWLPWSTLWLPAWLRWIGAGIGITAALLLYSIFRHLGINVSATAATRRKHRLVTTGPYRWVRHPLYSVASVFFVALGVLTTSWLFPLVGVLGFLKAARRLRREEAALIEKFGEEYRAYMNRTGRYIPRISARTRQRG